MRARIDFALEQFRCRGDRNLGNFTPQRLAGAGRVQLDLLLSCRNDAGALAARGAFRLLDEVVGAVLSLIDDLVGALASLTNDRLGPLTSLSKVFGTFL